MLVGSTFSGVGGLDLGLERAGMEVAFQCEIDARRRAVLERHWPGVRRYNDVRELADLIEQSAQPEQQHGAGGVRAEPTRRGAGDGGARSGEGASGREESELRVDLICGGFPCQDLSVAGRRAGLSGERSGLFWELVRILGALRPEWLLLENVPGLLSSPSEAPGRDFGLVLGALDELGYGVAWRILDSQHFGVPQRRRRVYIVGCAGGRADRAAAVLFESEGGGRDSTPGGKAGESVTHALRRSPRGVDEPTGTTYVTAELADTLNASDSRTTGHKGGQALVAAPLEASDGHHGHSSPRGDGADNLVATLRGRGHSPGVNPPGRGGEDDQNLIVDTLGTSADRVTGHGGGSGLVASAPADADGVRKTPGIAGRLDVPVCTCPDGYRYAGCGDAVTSTVAQWIGERLIMEHLNG